MTNDYSPPQFTVDLNAGTVLMEGQLEWADYYTSQPMPWATTAYFAEFSLSNSLFDPDYVAPHTDLNIIDGILHPAGFSADVVFQDPLFPNANNYGYDLAGWILTGPLDPVPLALDSFDNFRISDGLAFEETFGFGLSMSPGLDAFSAIFALFDVTVLTLQGDTLVERSLVGAQYLEEDISVEELVGNVAHMQVSNSADALDFTGLLANFHIDAGAGDDRIVGGIGDDVLHGGTGKDTLIGRAGDDVLSGGDDGDSILGRVGDDRLRGDAGKDKLFGGRGADTLSGERGNDMLHGDGGMDTIRGGKGNDLVSGGNGKDELWGGKAQDTLMGGNGGDSLKGGAGDDVLLDGAGRDILRGGAGADIFVLCVDMNNDHIKDFEDGLDLIDLLAWGDGLRVSDLAIRNTETGVRIAYDQNVLMVEAENQLLRSADLTDADFV